MNNEETPKLDREKVNAIKNEVLDILKSKGLTVYEADTVLSEASQTVRFSIKPKRDALMDEIYK